MPETSGLTRLDEAQGSLPAPPLVTGLADFHCLVKSPAEIETHIHPYYQLDVFPDGVISVLLEGRSPLETCPWNCVLIPPMTGHGYRIPASAWQISLKFHLHPRYWLRFGEPGGLVELPSWHGEMLREAFESFNSPSGGLGLRHVDGALCVCLAAWLKGQGSFRTQAPAQEGWASRMRSALETIAGDPARNWSVASLAKGCGLSPDSFCRRFKETAGKSPRRFIVELRMRTAANRLLRDGVAIKEAAREAGYSSVHSFSRAFSSVFGRGPASYLKSLPAAL